MEDVNKGLVHSLRAEVAQATPRPSEISNDLSPEALAIISTSFPLVEARGDEFASLFYNNLFETADVKHLFKGNMKMQGKKLVKMLKTAVQFIQDPGTLVPAVQALGVRHVGYGVRPEHYTAVGASIVWTLGTMLGEAFTEDAKTAWVTLYTLVAGIAIKAANEFEEPQMVESASSLPQSEFVIGNLTEADVAIIGSSFPLVEARGDEFASLFYNNLFETADVKHLFKGDITNQGKKLVGMLKTAVQVIRDPNALVPAVQALGVRHVGYGVRPEHYTAVGASIVWTLGTMLGEAFTEDAKTSWVKVYTLLSEVAIKAANDHEASLIAAPAVSESVPVPVPVPAEGGEGVNADSSLTPASTAPQEGATEAASTAVEATAVADAPVAAAETV